jgi:hypothetical protein
MPEEKNNYVKKFNTEKTSPYKASESIQKHRIDKPLNYDIAKERGIPVENLSESTLPTISDMTTQQPQMDIQVAIVTLILIAAIVYVARSIYKSAKGNACETGNCGCAKPVTVDKVDSFIK